MSAVLVRCHHTVYNIICADMLVSLCPIQELDACPGHICTERQGTVPQETIRYAEN